MATVRKLKNPIIPGFYPDPSICRVGDDFYLAVSSFELCPGIPLFHSKDLANWEKIGHAVTPENGFHVEANCGVGGVMAPTIRWHEGTFYIINANFADKGNYIVTAEDPRGPWSEPHWMNDVPGIDASIFFDTDGKCYVIGTGDVWENEGGRMERGIWIAEYDIRNFRRISEPFTIFNSALRGGASPEAPHIYHIGEYYYLIFAEGGTEHYHAVMSARSKELFSFFERNPANPIMTHRHMGFASPIINIGHADLIDLPDGSWYAVMLGSRLIDGCGKNLGRETFICPVVWERDWPLMSPQTGKVEWEYDAPGSLPWTGYEPLPARDDFDSATLDMDWTFWGTPYEAYWRLEDSALKIRCIRQPMVQDLQAMNFGVQLSEENYRPFIARRQLQPDCSVSLSMHFQPQEGETAGLALVQAMNHQLRMERCAEEGGKRQLLRVVISTADWTVPPYIPGFSSETKQTTLFEKDWDSSCAVLRIDMKGEDWTLYAGQSEEDLEELCRVDGRLVNPEKVGCMVGTMLGAFASGNGKSSDNEASFDWFELRKH